MAHNVSSRRAAQLTPQAVGNIVVTPAAASAVGATVAPTVVQGSLSLTPTAAAAAGSTVGPTVLTGGLAITPSPAAAAGATVAPAVVQSSLVITPTAAGAAGSTVNPTILDGATILYVNSQTGSDANNGLSSGAAKLTLQAAITALSGSAGTIHVNATSSAALREAVTYSGTTTVTIDGESGATWYLYGSERHTSGWASLGGGVYSKTLSWTPSATVYVYDTTHFYANGIEQRRMSRNSGTPTTPAAAQFGSVGAVLYVHLFGDLDPNSNPVEVLRYDDLLTMSGTGRLNLNDAVVRYSNGKSVHRSAGRMDCTTVTAQYTGGAGGFCTSGVAGQLNCTDCLSQFHANDGYNIHGNAGAAVIATLTTCDGSYNYDEGASPHDSTTLNIIGGRYHHNQYGGMTAINSAIVNLSGGAQFDINYSGTQDATEAAVTFKDTTTSGSINTIEVDHNLWRGVYIAPGANVTIVGLNSHDNAGLDSLPIAVSPTSATAAGSTVSPTVRYGSLLIIASAVSAVGATAGPTVVIATPGAVRELLVSVGVPQHKWFMRPPQE